MNTTSPGIWTEHSNKLEAFICGKMDDKSQCEDILHDIFLKIVEKEERIKLLEQPASYLIKMAQNAIVDFYRGRKKDHSKMQYEELAEREGASLQLADCCLLLFIQKLPPIYSEALIHTELEGMSQKAFAEKFHISYTGAKSRVQRAKILLKKAVLACCPYQFDKYGNIVSCCK